MAPDWGYFRTVPGSSRDRALSHVYVTAESTLLTARILDTNTLSLLAAKRALDGTISTDLRVFAEEIRAIAGDVDGTSKGGFFNYSARLQRRQLMEVVVRVGNNNSRAPTPLFSPPAATYKSAVHLRTVDTGLTFKPNPFTTHFFQLLLPTNNPRLSHSGAFPYLETCFLCVKYQHQDGAV